MCELCTDCRWFQDRAPDSLNWCGKHKTHLPPNCHGCESFQRQLDRFELCAAELWDFGGAGRDLTTPEWAKIIRRYFDVDRKAILEVIFAFLLKEFHEYDDLKREAQGMALRLRGEIMDAIEREGER